LIKNSLMNLGWSKEFIKEATRISNLLSSPITVSMECEKDYITQSSESRSSIIPRKAEIGTGIKVLFGLNRGTVSKSQGVHTCVGLNTNLREVHASQHYSLPYTTEEFIGQ